MGLLVAQLHPSPASILTRKEASSDRGWPNCTRTCDSSAIPAPPTSQARGCKHLTAPSVPRALLLPSTPSLFTVHHLTTNGLDHGLLKISASRRCLFIYFYPSLSHMFMNIKIIPTSNKNLHMLFAILYLSYPSLI